MSAMVNLTIDGIKVCVPEGTTVLEAARQANIHIPTLCYLKDINQIGACRICVVDTGAKALSAACVMPVSEGMVVKTNTPAVREARKVTLELILSNHERKCLSCVRSQNCELQTLAKELGVDESRFDGPNIHYEEDTLSPSLVRDPNKCILCRRCVAACKNIQGIGAIGAVNRGFDTIIAPAFGKSIIDTNCIFCGQCIEACPVGALREKDDTEKVWEAIADPDKFVVVQPAPAIRVALGEEFGMATGSRVTGKMTQALKRLGFDKVFDTDFGADLTIMEEATELLSRIKNGGALPMFTSCSPGWVKYCEHNFPELLPNLSTCKSPMEMEGAIIKTYYAEKAGIDPKKIVVVGVMPCTSKKFEAQRSEMTTDGMRSVDISITTRELARMIKQARIDFVNLPDEEVFDELVAESTGAAAIFGATGGVMEAALRTAADVLEGRAMEKVEYEAVRGLEGIKEATVTLGGQELKIAVAHSTGAAKKLIKRIQSGEASYAFVEVMACPGGCVNGGGQPIVSAYKRYEGDPRALRAAGLYTEDEAKALRKSHENPDIKKLYDEFLGAPNSHKAHELLHTTYTDRSIKL
ncbi:MAG: 4Fe-4S dicluster domain-containing protein [Clostridiales bacterium]|nr:4Fe-4S dicluster domain-containing protein [Clostridiales bacterium]MBQ2817145.1 iron hydrogenase small subunit [Clostridia bacterium]